jgi:acetylornithine deacetylase
MKGFNALAIQQITDLAQNKTQLKRPLHLVLTYDEEVGCLGAQHALDHARDKIQTPDLVVVGEPTGAEPVDAHKGIRCFHTHVHGLARHSSNPSDKDSIAGAFSLIKDLYELRSVLKDVRTFDGNRFDPPYTTMNIGKIAGGTVINTTPEHCSFDFEIRPIPGQNGEVVKLRHILSCEALSRGSGLEAKTNEWATVPSFLGDKDHPGSRLLLDVLFHDRKAETECITAPFTTEAGLYQHAGWNTLVWGPGDIAQAHTANEHIRVGQLQNYRKQLQKLTRHCLKP